MRKRQRKGGNKEIRKEGRKGGMEEEWQEPSFMFQRAAAP